MVTSIKIPDCRAKKLTLNAIALISSYLPYEDVFTLASTSKHFYYFGMFSIFTRRGGVACKHQEKIMLYFLLHRRNKKNLLKDMPGFINIDKIRDIIFCSIYDSSGTIWHKMYCALAIETLSAGTIKKNMVYFKYQLTRELITIIRLFPYWQKKLALQMLAKATCTLSARNCAPIYDEIPPHLRKEIIFMRFSSNRCLGKPAPQPGSRVTTGRGDSVFSFTRKYIHHVMIQSGMKP